MLSLSKLKWPFILLILDYLQIQVFSNTSVQGPILTINY